MSFSQISKKLQGELKSNNPQIRFLLKKSPGLAFTTINEIASSIGKKYNIKISLNFPERGKIEDYESYGTENIGFVFQRNAKSFSIPRDAIKSKALEILENIQIQDAYMYEGKEGVRAIGSNYRLDILPASLHIWGKINDEIRNLCDWLFENCYEVKPGVDGAFSETSS
ncbi:MAG: hypothetical protein KGH86_07745 [Thaumarchaeota archaeon]|nr:hypothetical protein [Nitrososphaerota archaeon]MDE1876701.1 hypothetical protein [Nitrososphaerota archaeon]